MEFLVLAFVAAFVAMAWILILGVGMLFWEVYKK